MLCRAKIAVSCENDVEQKKTVRVKCRVFMQAVYLHLVSTVI